MRRTARRDPASSARRPERSRLAGARRLLASAWRSAAGRFLILFPILASVICTLPILVPGTEQWMIRATLRSLALSRWFLASPVLVTGSMFSVGATSIQIVPDCTPLFPTLLLTGGILAYPETWRWRLVGLLAGAAFLWLYNLVRIGLLIVILQRAPKLFDLSHIFLWQSLTMLVVLGCFLAWIRLSPQLRATR